MRQGGIYTITHIETGRQYVGSAVYFKARWGHHRYQLRKNTHHSPALQHAWNKYGEEAFKFTILEVLTDYKNLLAAEQEQIDRRKPFFNSSQTAGLSAPRTGSYVNCDNCGEAVWKTPSQQRLGKHLYCSTPCSAKHRGELLKASGILKGKIVSSEQRAKNSFAATLQAIREREQGHKRPPLTPERKAAMKAGIKPATYETRLCAQCGAEVTRLPCHFRSSPDHTFCSRACAAVVLNPIKNKHRQGSTVSQEVVEHRRAGLIAAWARRKEKTALAKSAKQ